jgi:hypothetical protein
MSATEARAIAGQAIARGWATTPQDKHDRRHYNRMLKAQQRAKWVRQGLTTLGKPRQRRPNSGLNDDHTEYMRNWRKVRQGIKKRGKLQAKLKALRAEVARVEQELKHTRRYDCN